VKIKELLLIDQGLQKGSLGDLEKNSFGKKSSDSIYMIYILCLAVLIACRLFLRNFALDKYKDLSPFVPLVEVEDFLLDLQYRIFQLFAKQLKLVGWRQLRISRPVNLFLLPSLFEVILVT
jgi:hypothetical protein